MRTLLTYIFALVLALPVPTVSFVRTVLHVSHHDHDHGTSDTDHDHETEDQEADHSAGSDFSHKHAPGQPVHSHEMDVWNLFANPGVYQQPSLVFFPEYAPIATPVFEVKTLVHETFTGSVLRPPIA